MIIVLFFLASSKDVVARKLRLRRGGRREEGAAADQDQAKILRGMQDVPNLPPPQEPTKGQSLKLVFLCILKSIKWKLIEECQWK